MALMLFVQQHLGRRVAGAKAETEKGRHLVHRWQRRIGSSPRLHSMRLPWWAHSNKAKLFLPVNAIPHDVDLLYSISP